MSAALVGKRLSEMRMPRVRAECAGARPATATGRRRPGWETRAPSGYRGALRQMRGVGSSRQRKLFARCAHFGIESQSKVDRRSGARRQVSRASDLAGQAIRSRMHSLAQIAADIAQADAILKGKGKRLVLLDLHPMRKARRNQCDGQDGKEHRPLQRDQHADHTLGMAQDARSVKMPQTICGETARLAHSRQNQKSGTALLDPDPQLCPRPFPSSMATTTLS
jgi:hypothetical protein